MFREFKEFVMRGNILDVAIGLVLALAFGKIISSFVADILMPPIGLVLGRVDFSNLFIALNGQHYDTLAAAKAAGAATINYGLFLTAVIDFLIVAWVIFVLVKQMSRFRPAPAVVTRDCPYCYSVIPIKATRCGHCTSEFKTV